jgi:hypothetical protein
MLVIPIRTMMAKPIKPISVLRLPLSKGYLKTRCPISASAHDEHRNLCLTMNDSIGNAAKYCGC